MKTQTLKPAIETKRKPYWQNHFAIRNIEMNLNHTFKLIQDAIASSPVSISLDELKSCIGPDPYRKADLNIVESLIRRKILENVDMEQLKIMGLKMDENKVKGLIAIPKYSEFAGKLKKFSEIMPSVGISNNTLYWECFSLVDGIVSMDIQEVEKLKDAYRDYAINEEQQERVDRLQAICDLLNSLVKDYPELNPALMEIPDLVLADIKGVFCPHDRFVKNSTNMGCINSSLTGAITHLAPATASPAPNFELKKPEPTPARSVTDDIKAWAAQKK